MGFTYHRYNYSPDTPIPDALLDELLGLASTLFPDLNLVDSRWRLQNMPVGTSFCARFDDRLVGFKTGYATKRRHYYSWLGGVHPDWLRQGIARQLMKHQHQWLRQQGFHTVETGAQEDNRAMCALNLASGFVQVGTRSKARGRQCIFEKALGG